MDKEINEVLVKILDKLDTLEQGQRSLEQGQRSLEQGQRSLEQRLLHLETDVAQIKEDTAITRSSVNTLLRWAEEVQVQVGIPLIKNN